MSIRRVVPNMRARHGADSRAFYVDVLGLELVMDMDFIKTFASPSNPTDEPWGVRRFYAREPNGAVVNVMAHRPVETGAARPS
jgi:hypothetical protein